MIKTRFTLLLAAVLATAASFAAEREDLPVNADRPLDREARGTGPTYDPTPRANPASAAARSQDEDDC